MSYATQETSANSGQPAEIYLFVQGNNRWLYTSYGIPIVYNGETYSPITIKRTQVDQSQEVESGSITVTVPRDNPVAGKFILYNPTRPVWLTVVRLHMNDSALEPAIQFVGRITNVSFNGSEAAIKCAPVQEILQRKVPRCLYQSVCNHVLYSPYCGVSGYSYRLITAAQSVSGNDVYSNALAGYADNWFTHGYVIRNADEFRMIISHTGNKITLISPFPSLSSGDVLEVYPGCDRTEGTCASKFNNRINFLGWTYIPTKNPFNVGIT